MLPHVHDTGSTVAQSLSGSQHSGLFGPEGPSHHQSLGLWFEYGLSFPSAADAVVLRHLPAPLGHLRGWAVARVFWSAPRGFDTLVSRSPATPVPVDAFTTRQRTSSHWNGLVFAAPANSEAIGTDRQ